MEHPVVCISSSDLPAASRLMLQDTTSVSATLPHSPMPLHFQHQATGPIYPATTIGQWRLSGEVIAMPARRKRFRSNSDGSLPIFTLSTALSESGDHSTESQLSLQAATADGRKASTSIRRIHTYTGTFGPLLLLSNNDIIHDNEDRDHIEQGSSQKAPFPSRIHADCQSFASDQQQQHDSGQTSPLDLSENLRRCLSTTDNKYQQCHPSHTISSQREEAAGTASQKSDDNEEVFLTHSTNDDNKFAFDSASINQGERGEMEACSLETSSPVSKLQQLELLDTSGDSERDDTVRTYLTACGGAKKLKVKQYLQIKYQQSVASELELRKADRLVVKTEGEDTDTEEDDKLMTTRKYHSESEALDKTENIRSKHDVLIQPRSSSALLEMQVAEDLCRRRRLPHILRPWINTLSRADTLHPSSSSASEGESEIMSGADVMLSPGGDVFTLQPEASREERRANDVGSSSMVATSGISQVQSARTLAPSPRQRFMSTVSEADDVSIRREALKPVMSSTERTKEILRQKLQMKKQRLQQQLQLNQGKSSSTSEDDVIDLTDERLRHSSSSSSARATIYDLSKSSRRCRSSHSTVSESSPEIRNMLFVDPSALSASYQASNLYSLDRLSGGVPRTVHNFSGITWQHLLQDLSEVPPQDSSSLLMQHRQSQRRKTSDEQVGSRKKTAGTDEDILAPFAASTTDETAAAAASSSRVQAFQQYAEAQLQPTSPHLFASNFQRHHHHHAHHRAHKVPRSSSTHRHTTPPHRHTTLPHRHTTPPHRLPDQGGSSSCPETTETTASSSSHRLTKQHKCDVCSRAFSRSDMLSRHMRLHTGVRPYACAVCGLVFSRSDHLNTHMRTHTGEKPYKCPHCPYAAPRRDQISRHIRIHVQEAELLRQAAAMGTLPSGESLEFAAELFPAGWFVVSPELTYSDMLLSSTSAGLAAKAGLEATRDKLRKHAIGSSGLSHGDSSPIRRHSEFGSSLSLESLTTTALDSDSALPIAERMASRLFVNSPVYISTDREQQSRAESRMSPLSPRRSRTADDTSSKSSASSAKDSHSKHEEQLDLQSESRNKSLAIAKLKQSLLHRQQSEQVLVTNSSKSPAAYCPLVSEETPTSSQKLLERNSPQQTS